MPPDSQVFPRGPALPGRGLPCTPCGGPRSDRRANRVCRQHQLTIDRWSVVSIARHIEVPAGIFEDCLCVRRRAHVIGDTPGFEDEDKTYCFARGVGKVFEHDRRDQLVECLAHVCRDGVCDPATGPPCDWYQLDGT